MALIIKKGNDRRLTVTPVAEDGRLTGEFDVNVQGGVQTPTAGVSIRLDQDDILPLTTALQALLHGRTTCGHTPYGGTAHCVEMACSNYVSKAAR